MPRVWRLIRAGQVDPNPTTVVQRAGTSAASAPDGTVLVTRRDRDGLAHYLIAPQTPGVDQAALHTRGGNRAVCGMRRAGGSPRPAERQVLGRRRHRNRRPPAAPDIPQDLQRPRAAAPAGEASEVPSRPRRTSQMALRPSLDVRDRMANGQRTRRTDRGGVSPARRDVGDPEYR